MVEITRLSFFSLHLDHQYTLIRNTSSLTQVKIFNMKLLQPHNIIEESWPSAWVTGIIGLRPLIIERIKAIGYLYMLIFWILYCVMVSLTIDYANDIVTEWRIISKSIRIKPVGFVMDILCCVLIVAGSILNRINDENSNSLLLKYDEKLNLLNVKFIYKTFMKAQHVHILTIGMLTVLMGFIEYANLQSASRKNTYVLVCITNQLPQLVSSFATVPFVAMCMRVRKRNEVINDLIPTMTNTAKNIPGNLSLDMNNVFRVKLLSEAYGLLADVVATVNNTYALVLLVSFSSSIAWIFVHLHLGYTAYQVQAHYADITMELLLVMFFLLKCVLIIDASHSVNSQIESFARRVETTNIRFTVYNLFVIDYGILLKMFLESALMLLLVSALASGRPEPPIGQYLSPEQQYGPPRKNEYSGDGSSGQNGQNVGFGTNQYLPPNQQYGPPGGGAGGGYDDGSNDSPAKYEFEYMVNDAESGNDFGHKESRDDDVTRGVYYVLLPDGRRQTVEYIADQNGFRPVVTYTQEATGNGYRNDGGVGYPSGNNGYRY
ncbi:uncharacterized protein [Fopius arisanus]|uniref:Uncharacterized protein isoform X2 n=1 Tax=Fopius arisanus TaxID=64838 RepID=A0A9R1UBV2_9HYME|nr:PREDICTED: uncharacterized protein LOC105273913 isoform X2 [Fopius arisanus]